jgi:misacylated tRNA(Ala) deacylase
MARYFCHQHPDLLNLETTVLNSRPGAVLLRRSPFHPGGGGQLADRGWLCWAGGEVVVTGFEVSQSGIWHLLADPLELSGDVEVTVEPRFRAMMSQLHSATHILNALVYRHFNGALVTGAQMNEDGTARMDFDLPDAANDRLRALEPEINDAIRRDIPIDYSEMALADAQLVSGLIRSRSVAPPPTPDGMIRIVEILDLDRQACGGTHVASTGACQKIRILKVDNKGRHNRRLRIALSDRIGC